MLNNLKLNKRNIFLVLIGMYAFISIIDYWFLYRFVHVGQLFDFGRAPEFIYSHLSPLFYASRRNLYWYYSALAGIYLLIIYMMNKRTKVNMDIFMGKVFCFLLIVLANLRFLGDLTNINIWHPFQYHLVITFPSYIILMLVGYILRQVLSRKTDINVLFEKKTNKTICRKLLMVVLLYTMYIYISVSVLFWFLLIVLTAGKVDIAHVNYNIIGFFTTVSAEYMWFKYFALVWLLVVSIFFWYICHSFYKHGKTAKNISLCKKGALTVVCIKFFEASFVEGSPLWVNFQSMNVLPTFLLLWASIEIFFACLDTSEKSLLTHLR